MAKQKDLTPAQRRALELVGKAKYEHPHLSLTAACHFAGVVPQTYDRAVEKLQEIRRRPKIIRRPAEATA